MQTAQQGQPHSGRMGFEIFDKMSWGQTEFDQKVTYQRALEGELERTDSDALDVAERARTPGDADGFGVSRPPATAQGFGDSEAAARQLSKDAVLAISRLVSGAVDELKPEDVSIIDADSARSLGLKP